MLSSTTALCMARDTATEELLPTTSIAALAASTIGAAETLSRVATTHARHRRFSASRLPLLRRLGGMQCARRRRGAPLWVPVLRRHFQGDQRADDSGSRTAQHGLRGRSRSHGTPPSNPPALGSISERGRLRPAVFFFDHWRVDAHRHSKPCSQQSPQLFVHPCFSMASTPYGCGPIGSTRRSSSPAAIAASTALPRYPWTASVTCPACEAGC